MTDVSIQNYAENYRKCTEIYNRIQKLGNSPVGVALFNGVAQWPLLLDLVRKIKVQSFYCLRYVRSICAPSQGFKVLLIAYFRCPEREESFL